MQTLNDLTWPTSAGAMVELMCSTACETPVKDTLEIILSKYYGQPLQSQY